MGMNTALARCSNATLANNASKATTGCAIHWHVEHEGAGAGRGGGGLCASHGFAGRRRGRLRYIGAGSFFRVRRQGRAISEGSVGEGCGAVTDAFMRGLWGSPGPLYVVATCVTGQQNL